MKTAIGIALVLMFFGIAGCGPQTAQQQQNTAMLLNALVGMQQAEAIRTQRPASVNVWVNE